MFASRPQKSKPVATAPAVTVWWLQIDPSAECYRVVSSGLSSDERARAERFHFDRDRNAFAMMRLLLRRLLAHQLGCTASEITFEYNEYGKPSLPQGQPHFNISHSSGWGVCAIDPQAPVGVDIEGLNRIQQRERLTLARRFFGAGEVAQLEALDESELEEAFIACWCRKEAYIKRHGLGLSLPLDRFEVDAAPRTQGTLLRSTSWNSADLQQSRLIDLKPPPGCRAALCYESDRSVTVVDAENSAAILPAALPRRAG
jgi:4'-phosphopantetheinyl transferase